MVLFKVQYVGRVPLTHDDAAPFDSDDGIDAIKFLRRLVPPASQCSAAPLRC